MSNENLPAEQPGSALVNWEEELAKYADEAIQQEGTGSGTNYFSFQAGQMKIGENLIPGNKLDVVVADYIFENDYYAEPYDAKKKEKSPPVCFAFGRDEKTLAPHPDSVDPQAKSCALCPHNAWGTAEKGAGKRCKQIRRLLVLPAEPVDAESFLTCETAVAKLPITSVKYWVKYVKQVYLLRKRSPKHVVSEMAVVPDPASQFKVEFTHRADLTKPQWDAIQSRAAEYEKILFTPYKKPEVAEPPKPAATAKKKKF